MKRKTLIISIIFLWAVILLSLGCATGKRVSINTDEVLTTLTGTWTNPEYNETLMPAKYIMNTDGNLDLFLTETSDTVAYRAQYWFDDVWRDRKGNIWYKAKFKFEKGAPTEDKEYFYEMGKINESQSTWEHAWNSSGYPLGLNDGDQNIYRILYR